MAERSETASLGALAEAAGGVLERVQGDASAEVRGLSYDSRAAGAGDLFFCVPGTVTDGHGFAAAAIEAGASSLCVERSLDLGVPQVVVSDVRVAMARMSARFFGDPASALKILGVTGTNGKTTTAFLLESILHAAGSVPGLIGTIQTRIGSRIKPGVRTTPESLDLQKLLAEMRDASCDSVAMEVTSHALEMARVEGVPFAAAVFTNLSQDHLDFHRDMDAYFDAKKKLFVGGASDAAAINADDAYGRRLADEATVPVVTFGTSPDAQVRATDVELGPSGSRFVMSVRGIDGAEGEVRVTTRLAGRFNVSNCLAAGTGALLAGIPAESVAEGIARLEAVPGRFESIDMGQPFAVVVDYAHTPDSLENVLQAARSLGRGRLIAVFGCGGDRDRGKRPLMGAVAARHADVVVVTSDNPRSEDPGGIVEEIVAGVKEERGGSPDEAIVDRREAIERAIDIASPGDVVVIAGKGHETGQQFADVTIPFDDREVAREVLGSKGQGGAA